MELFGFLEGLSPWYWVVFAFVLGAIEMATMSFFLIWPALAALLMAMIILAVPTLSGVVQILCFAVLSVALTFAGRAVMERFGDGGGSSSGLNNRAGAMIGRQAKVLSYDGGEGTIEIDGIRWKAVWDGPNAVNGIVKVEKAEGMILRVTAV